MVRVKVFSERRIICGLFAVLWFMFCAPHVNAHDVPRIDYDRLVHVKIAPQVVRVSYRLEVSTLTLYHLPRIDDKIIIPTPSTEKIIAEACLKRFEVLVPSELVAELNDELIEWKVEQAYFESHGGIIFHLNLRGDRIPKADANQFSIDDGNFKGQPGAFRLKISTEKGAELTALDEPDERKGETKRTGIATVHVPPELAVAKEKAEPEPLPPPPTKPQSSFWDLLFGDDPTELLNREVGVLALLIFAVFHGMLHSVMPGHGKTMVAAYLVGERGTPKHAILLGVITTLTHTSAAVGVALILRYSVGDYAPQDIQNLLKFIGGLMIAGIGLWLFLQRIAGRSDHVHLFEGLGHSHSHGDAIAPTIGKMGTIRLILLGVAGGIIPCWGAILWVIALISTGHVWLALPAVLCFSAGLAAVLIALGLSVVYASRIGNTRVGKMAWYRRWVNERTIKWLPIIGAAAVIVIGLWMCGTSNIRGR